MSDVVHMAPEGVTKEWFNTVEHPRYPCGAPTTLDTSWKPRLWQVTCERCRDAVMPPITYDPSDGSAKGVRG